MIGLLKNPLSIYQSRWREIQNALPVFVEFAGGPKQGCQGCFGADVTEFKLHLRRRLPVALTKKIFLRYCLVCQNLKPRFSLFQTRLGDTFKTSVRDKAIHKRVAPFCFLDHDSKRSQTHKYDPRNEGAPLTFWALTVCTPILLVCLLIGASGEVALGLSPSFGWDLGTIPRSPSL